MRFLSFFCYVYLFYFKNLNVAYAALNDAAGSAWGYKSADGAQSSWAFSSSDPSRFNAGTSYQSAYKPTNLNTGVNYQAENQAATNGVLGYNGGYDANPTVNYRTGYSIAEFNTDVGYQEPAAGDRVTYNGGYVVPPNIFNNFEVDYRATGFNADQGGTGPVTFAPTKSHREQELEDSTSTTTAKNLPAGFNAGVPATDGRVKDYNGGYGSYDNAVNTVVNYQSGYNQGQSGQTFAAFTSGASNNGGGYAPANNANYASTGFNYRSGNEPTRNGGTSYNGGYTAPTGANYQAGYKSADYNSRGNYQSGQKSAPDSEYQPTDIVESYQCGVSGNKALRCVAGKGTPRGNNNK